MIFQRAECLLEEAEALVLLLPAPRSWIERLFQRLILKPWRYFVAGYDHIGMIYLRFFLAFLIVFFFLNFAQHVALGERSPYSPYEKEIFGEISAALLLLVPLLFRLFSSPKDYGLSIDAKLIHALSNKIESGFKGTPFLSFVEKNLTEMQTVAQKRVTAAKFGLGALWSGFLFFASKDPKFPFDLIDNSGRIPRPVPGVMFLFTLLLGLSGFILGLGLISEKVFLSIKLAINEYNGYSQPSRTET